MIEVAPIKVVVLVDKPQSPQYIVGDDRKHLKFFSRATLTHRQQSESSARRLTFDYVHLLSEPNSEFVENSQFFTLLDRFIEGYNASVFTINTRNPKTKVNPLTTSAIKYVERKYFDSKKNQSDRPEVYFTMYGISGSSCVDLCSDNFLEKYTIKMRPHSHFRKAKGFDEILKIISKPISVPYFLIVRLESGTTGSTLCLADLGFSSSRASTAGHTHSRTALDFTHTLHQHFGFESTQKQNSTESLASPGENASAQGENAMYTATAGPPLRDSLKRLEEDVQKLLLASNNEIIDMDSCYLTLLCSIYMQGNVHATWFINTELEADETKSLLALGDCIRRVQNICYRGRLDPSNVVRLLKLQEIDETRKKLATRLYIQKLDMDKVRAKDGQATMIQTKTLDTISERISQLRKVITHCMCELAKVPQFLSTVDDATQKAFLKNGIQLFNARRHGIARDAFDSTIVRHMGTPAAEYIAGKIDPVVAFENVFEALYVELKGCKMDIEALRRNFEGSVSMIKGILPSVKESEVLARRLTSVTDLCNDYKDKTAALSTRVAELELDLENTTQSYKSELDDERSKTERQKAEIDLLKVKLEQMNLRLQDANAEKQSLKASLDRAMHEKSTVGARVQESERQKIDEYKNECIKLRDQLQTEKARNKELMEEILGERVKKIRFEEKYEEARTKIEKLEAMMHNKEKDTRRHRAIAEFDKDNVPQKSSHASSSFSSSLSEHSRNNVSRENRVSRDNDRHKKNESSSIEQKASKQPARPSSSTTDDYGLAVGSTRSKERQAREYPQSEFDISNLVTTHDYSLSTEPSMLTQDESYRSNKRGESRGPSHKSKIARGRAQQVIDSETELNYEEEDFRPKGLDHSEKKNSRGRPRNRREENGSVEPTFERNFKKRAQQAIDSEPELNYEEEAYRPKGRDHSENKHRGRPRIRREESVSVEPTTVERNFKRRPQNPIDSETEVNHDEEDYRPKLIDHNEKKPRGRPRVRREESVSVKPVSKPVVAQRGRGRPRKIIVDLPIRPQNVTKIGSDSFSASVEERPVEKAQVVEQQRASREKEAAGVKRARIDRSEDDYAEIKENYERKQPSGSRAVPPVVTKKYSISSPAVSIAAPAASAVPPTIMKSAKIPLRKLQAGFNAEPSPYTPNSSGSLTAHGSSGSFLGSQQNLMLRMNARIPSLGPEAGLRVENALSSLSVPATIPTFSTFENRN